MRSNDRSKHRLERFKRLLEEKFSGNKAALGRAMGLTSGAYVRQLVDQERPVTEKVIDTVHAIPGCEGWFDVDQTEDADPLKGVSSFMTGKTPVGRSLQFDQTPLVVPHIEWGQGVNLAYTSGVRFDALALPSQVGSGARRLAFPDDSMSNEGVRKGDVVVVEFGASPLPGDIVFCRAKRVDVEFPGKYIQQLTGGAYIEINQPGFDRRVDAEQVDILAVVMYQLIARRGRAIAMGA